MWLVAPTTDDGLGSSGALTCSGGTGPQDDEWPLGPGRPICLSCASSVSRVMMVMQVPNLERY